MTGINACPAPLSWIIGSPLYDANVIERGYNSILSNHASFADALFVILSSSSSSSSS